MTESVYKQVGLVNSWRGCWQILVESSFCLFLFFMNKKAIVSRFMDEIGSVDKNQTAEQFYPQPVLGWLINRRHELHFFLHEQKSLSWLSGLFVCLFTCTH